LQLKINSIKLFKSKFKKILYRKISEKNFNVNGKPLNKIREIKIKTPNNGVVCIIPLIRADVREKYLLYITSMIKKNNVDKKQCVTTKIATTKIFVLLLFNSGKKIIFISCTVLYAINFFKSN
jgi:hypothetical protein